MWLWTVLVICSTPFSIPSFYLAHKLLKKRFLDSVFNQHIALMMVFAGRFSIKLLLLKPILHLLMIRIDTSVQPCQCPAETPDLRLSQNFG